MREFCHEGHILHPRSLFSIQGSLYFLHSLKWSNIDDKKKYPVTPLHIHTIVLVLGSDFALLTHGYIICQLYHYNLPRSQDPAKLCPFLQSGGDGDNLCTSHCMGKCAHLRCALGWTAAFLWEDQDPLILLSVLICVSVMYISFSPRQLLNEYHIILFREGIQSFNPIWKKIFVSP